MKTSTIFLSICFFGILYCCSNKGDKPQITVDYQVERVQNHLLRVDFFLKNNTPADYFIPFIKPASYYSTYSDKESSEGIQGNIDPSYYLSNKLLSREDLHEAAQLDSLYYLEEKDTITFYFEQPFIKKEYDSILHNFGNKHKLRFIYAYFYHALANGCVYLKSGETKKIPDYVYHYDPLEIENLIVSFDFDTKSIPNYKKRYFKSIPKKIGTYILFKGRIKTDS